MAKGDAFWNRRRRMIAVEERLNDNGVADNRKVRIAIMKRVESGEITLKEGKKELANLKHDAKKNNKETLF